MNICISFSRTAMLLFNRSINQSINQYSFNDAMCCVWWSRPKQFAPGIVVNCLTYSTLY